MNKCNLVTDLLPLYAEDLLSEDSKQLVERHLAKCAACSEKLKLLKTTDSVPMPPPENAPEEREVLKKTRKKLKKHTAAVAAASVCLSLIVVFCAVFFPVRIKEVRDILYPYPVTGPLMSYGVVEYPTDSMIKLGEPIETFTREPPEDGELFTFDNFYGFSEPDTPAVTLFLPETYRRIDEGAELENTNLYIGARENSFESVFGIGQDDVSSDAPVAVYCKEHSLTTWTEIADYTITYRKSEFSLLFSSNNAVRYTADIFRVRDVVIGTWRWTVKDGRCYPRVYCYPQVYHPFRGSFEGYAFSHEGAQGNWDISVTTERFVYHMQISSLEGEKVLFPDEKSIAALLSTATFV